VVFVLRLFEHANARSSVLEKHWRQIDEEKRIFMAPRRRKMHVLAAIIDLFFKTLHPPVSKPCLRPLSKFKRNIMACSAYY
jgi:hypothetical protein